MQEAALAVGRFVHTGVEEGPQQFSIASHQQGQEPAIVHLEAQLSGGVENIITVYENGASHHGVFLNAGSFPGDLNRSAVRMIHHAMRLIMKDSPSAKSEKIILFVRVSCPLFLPKISFTGENAVWRQYAKGIGGSCLDKGRIQDLFPNPSMDSGSWGF
jgi:hypothetical protein